MPHVGDGTSAKLVPATEHVVGVLLVVGHIWNGPKPELPVKSFRNGLGCSRATGPLLPHGAVGPVVNFLQVTDQARIHPGLHLSVFRTI